MMMMSIGGTYQWGKGRGKGPGKECTAWQGIDRRLMIEPFQYNTILALVRDLDG